MKQNCVQRHKNVSHLIQVNSEFFKNALIIKVLSVFS